MQPLAATFAHWIALVCAHHQRESIGFEIWNVLSVNATRCPFMFFSKCCRQYSPYFVGRKRIFKCLFGCRFVVLKGFFLLVFIWSGDCARY